MLTHQMHQPALQKNTTESVPPRHGFQGIRNDSVLSRCYCFTNNDQDLKDNGTLVPNRKREGPMTLRGLPPALSEPPRPDPICAVIGRSGVDEAISDLVEAGKRKVCLAEIRLDMLNSLPDLSRFVLASSVPLLATVRRKRDGGHWEGAESDRLELLRLAVASGFAWVDIEEDVIADFPRIGTEKRIVSFHDCTGVPADLGAIYARMAACDADTIKLVCLTSTPGEVASILHLHDNPPKPTVAFGMGDVGQASRIVQLKLGAPFTYAAVNADTIAAPGMLTISQLQLNFGVRRINASTQLFGVVGAPLGHSLSPIIHNNGFRKLGRNDLYVPFTVPKGMLEEFLTSHAFLGIRGLSVTIPHKEDACRLAAVRSPEVVATGSANTLLLGQDGGIAASNTDYDAVLDSVLAGLKNHPDGWTLKGKRALVLGAGGVARSVVCGLTSQGADVRLAGRTQERAEAIASMVPCAVVPWENRHDSPVDIVVNCTPVGMHPDVDQSPVDPGYLVPGLVVMDTIYNPENTLLIRQAREKGAVAVTGLDMFIGQAAAQFKLFTGEQAPVDLMRQVARNALAIRQPRPVASGQVAR